MNNVRKGNTPTKKLQQLLKFPSPPVTPGFPLLCCRPVNPLTWTEQFLNGRVNVIHCRDVLRRGWKVHVTFRPHPIEMHRELWTPNGLYVGREMFLILSLLPRITLYNFNASLYFAMETPQQGHTPKACSSMYSFKKYLSAFYVC